MSKEILMVADAVSNEKGMDKEIIFEAIEAALASASARNTERTSMSALQSIEGAANTRPSGGGGCLPTIPTNWRSRSGN